jgi:hypothetical protein
MTRTKTITQLRALVTGATTSLAVGVLLTGCGSSGGAKSASATQPVAPTTAAATSATTATATPASLRILAPAAGSNTGSNVTVHVRVSGGSSGRPALRYLLDGRLSRRGSTQLTYRELAPGRHTVVVSLVGDGSVRSARSFVVRAPAPPPPEPAHTTPAEPAPTTQMGSEHERSAPPPEPKPEPKQAPPETKPSPPEGGGIPQGGGGDGDGDNSGGPSDGDGNV